MKFSLSNAEICLVAAIFSCLDSLIFTKWWETDLPRREKRNNIFFYYLHLTSQTRIKSLFFVKKKFKVTSLPFIIIDLCKWKCGNVHLWEWQSVTLSYPSVSELLHSKIRIVAFGKMFATKQWHFCEFADEDEMPNCNCIFCWPKICFVIICNGWSEACNFLSCSTMKCTSWYSVSSF